MKNNNSIKTFVAIGIGAALFFVLGRFVAIPSPVPNTNISLQYAVLALLAAMYGPVAGGLIGFIGHALIDLSWGGIPWWSWVITSAFVGVVVGLFTKKLHVEEGDFNKKKVGVFALANVIANLIGWIVVAPVLDILIYAEPAKRCLRRACLPVFPTALLLWSWAVCWCWLTPRPLPRKALWIKNNCHRKAFPWPLVCGKAFLFAALPLGKAAPEYLALRYHAHV